jgi:hypothetical protein
LQREHVPAAAGARPMAGREAVVEEREAPDLG